MNNNTKRKLFWISLSTILGLICIAATKISDYANTTTLGPNDLFVVATPGVTDKNIKVKDLPNALQVATTNLNGIMHSNQVRQLNRPATWNDDGPPLMFNVWGYSGFGTTAQDITNYVGLIKTGKFDQSGRRPIVVWDEGLWDSTYRDGANHLRGSTTKCPDGISNVVQWAHSQGVGFGVYYVSGIHSESPTMNGGQATDTSLGFILQDAQDFANMGMDLIKFNAANNISSQDRNDEVQQAFIKACQTSSNTAPYIYLMPIGGTTSAKRDWYEWVPGWLGGNFADGNTGGYEAVGVLNYNFNEQNIGMVRPGHYLSFEGSANSTQIDANSMMVLWAHSSAQIIMTSPDTDKTRSRAWTNKTYNAIWQVPVKPYLLTNWSTPPGTNNAIWIKPLNLTNKAVTLINRATNANTTTFIVPCTNLSLAIPDGVVTVFDASNQCYVAYVTNGNFSATLRSNSAAMYRMEAGKVDPFGKVARFYLSDYPMLNGASTNSALNIGSISDDFQQNRQPNGDPITIDGTTFYEKGIGARANATLEWWVGGQADWFHVTAGAPNAYKGGNGMKVKVTVAGDGVTLFDSGQLSDVLSDPGTNIYVNISGRMKLTVQVLTMQGGGVPIIFDGCNLADISLLKNVDGQGVTNLQAPNLVGTINNARLPNTAVITNRLGVGSATFQGFSGSSDLDIASGRPGGILLGAEFNTTTRTVNQTKNGSINAVAYDNGDTPTMFYYADSSSSSIMYLGGNVTGTRGFQTIALHPVATHNGSGSGGSDMLIVSVAGVQVGGGQAIKKILSTTSVIDFPSTAAQTSSDSTGITLTGVAVGDTVEVGGPVPPNNGVFSAFVSAADTVKVRFNNYSAAAIDPASATFRITVTQF